MSKIILDIDIDLSGKALSKFLKDNKKKLMAQKKAAIKRTDAISFAPSFYIPDGEDGTARKAISIAEIPEDADIFNVRVVANTSMYCDSAMDVLGKDSAKKSIRERKGAIPHIHDHDWTVTSEVGDVNSIYYQDVPLRDLGWKGEGTAQALVFDTDIKREYNEEVFKKYRAGRIKQHSIGLQYDDLLLALNEPDDEYYEDEFKVWKKWIDQIINKDYVEERGYFWYVPQYKLLENSCVLFGANPLTPTLSTGEKQNTDLEPLENTPEKPEEQKADVFDLDIAIMNFKLKTF